MSGALIYACAGAVLFVFGVTGLILLPHLLRKILAFNIMGSGVFLVLVGLGQRDGTPDPVPQAMVLTGIVVAVAATALAWQDTVPGRTGRLGPMLEKQITKAECRGRAGCLILSLG